MKKLSITVAVLAMIVVLIGGCKKKESAPQTQSPAVMTPTIVMPKGKTKIIVPEEVKKSWKAVKIEIEDKKANKKTEVTIDLHSEYKIPDSNLTIKVGDFLPDFRMDGLTITSASNEPRNPAVHINVYENDKEIFQGWLYEKFPTIHPFQHERFKLTLIEGIKAG